MRHRETTVVAATYAEPAIEQVAVEHPVVGRSSHYRAANLELR